jgi:Protein of unknown function (DUF2723)
VLRHRSAALALLLIFLAAHLALLPRTLEDLDSINFALGVRQFDVARHQPHPPGYPVYIALAKVSTATVRFVGFDAAAPRGLAVWSALAGAAALPALFLFFRRLEGRDRLAWWATLVVAASPLFWFSALRPLSDMLGFSAAMWAIALMIDDRNRRGLLLGAVIAGLAAGVRSQTAILTLPMLAFALVRGESRARIGALGAFAIGVLAWGVPLIVVSGGLPAYLESLGAQAGEDFSGVVMLWTSHSRRDVVYALLNTFVWPWDWWLGLAVCALAAAGAARMAWRAPRALATLVGLFLPYAVFHLLFQETATTRYALPLVPVMAYLAMAAVEGLPGGALPVAALGVSAISLMETLPASLHYSREGAPVFRAFDDMAATAHGGDPVNAIGLHAQMRRASEWAAPILPARVLRAPHGREWLTLVSLWKSEPSARVWFVADPDRTDLALFDPRARDLARAYRWGFVEPPFVGGARPDNVDWLRMGPPNWMLDRGWSLTAEIGGVTARDQLGPHIAPAIAWLRRQPDELTVVLGGRNLSASDVTIVATLAGAPVARYPLPPRSFFMRTFTVPAGALNASSAYLPLEITSEGGSALPVSLEQFDAQPPGVPMFGYDTGWQEPEFNRSERHAWRWMSEKSELWVRPVGRPVTLRIGGESPMRYFDAAPHVRISIGGREIGAFDPGADFDQAFTLPPDLLAAANGRVLLESSKFFVPGGAGGGGDQRHLALRVYSVTVE